MSILEKTLHTVVNCTLGSVKQIYIINKSFLQPATKYDFQLVSSMLKI